MYKMYMNNIYIPITKYTVYVAIHILHYLIYYNTCTLVINNP